MRGCSGIIYWITEMREPNATLYTPVCELLGSPYPIVCAGMGGVARAELVAAVTRAGGFGFLGMVREPIERIHFEVGALRERGVARFGVNLIPAATEPALLNMQVTACIKLRVPVVGLFWDIDDKLVRRLRDAGILVVYQVGSVDEARAAESAGAQILIAQGVEAGGHVRGSLPLAELLPEVVTATNVPVLAAGGLAGGDDLATVLSLGAQGAVFGTALIATHESFAHDHHKQRLLTARSGDTRLTDVFRINWPRGARVRVLASSVTDGRRGTPFAAGRTVIGDEVGRPIHLFSTDSPLRSTTGDLEAMALYAGQGVGRVDSIVGAGERVQNIAADAAALMRPGATEIAEHKRYASPVCYAHEFETTTFTPEARQALLANLNTLLEAERAGARVALRTAAEAGEERRPLVVDIHRDEARWCAVLTRAIRKLGGLPSTKTGDFYAKAMAITDLDARMVFLNRGQAWVVRKLNALIPTLPDGQILADLRMMLDAHERNIARVSESLDASDRGTGT